MKPRRTNNSQSRLFEQRLSEQLNPNHELLILTDFIDWDMLEIKLGNYFAHEVGTPAKPVRLVIGIILLQQMYKISDEEVLYKWVENPYWQIFCGYDYLQWKFPIHSTTLTKWRQRLGVEGIENVFELLIHTATDCGMVKPSSLAKVIADTTVMPKAITFPTDAKLYLKGIKRLVKFAKSEGLALRQTYRRLAVNAQQKAARLLHSRKFKQAAREIKRLKTYLSRVWHDLMRQIQDDQDLMQRAAPTLLLIGQILFQGHEGLDKIYSVHEPHVECLAKGKAGRKYEFGCKVSIVLTHREGLALNTMAHHGNPYDGHTLEQALGKAEQLSGKKISQAFVDKGYKGHGIKDKEVFLSGSGRGKSRSLRKAIERRQAIEPHIGHMKSEGKLGKNFLKGVLGDKLNALLCGIGHNLRLLRNFFRKQAIPKPA